MRSRAFTLIELLIVVAIIAILAAIAVPNFLEAQVRSKVSCTMSDQRTIALALEGYRVDFNHYPFYPDPGLCNGSPPGFLNSCEQSTLDLWWGYVPFSLTTPIAYLTTLPTDCFKWGKGHHPNLGQGGGAIPKWALNELGWYHYDFEFAPQQRSRWGDRPGHRVPEAVKFMLAGIGPDLITPLSSTGFHNNTTEMLQLRDGAAGTNAFYDPTNGTVSGGDIIYHGPSVGYDRKLLVVPNPD